MSRVLKAAVSLVILASSAACTQPAAQVDLRGQQSFARGSAPSDYTPRVTQSRPYSAPSQSAGYQPYQPAPIYTNTPRRDVPQHTEQSAGTSSIGVSDLAPPSKDAVKQPEEKPQSATAAPSNPWTKKPRELHAQAPKDAQPAPVATLQAPATKAPAEPVKAVAAAKQPAGKFIWPVSQHKVISSFGPKGGGKANDGINIASLEGEPVWATADGEVVYVGNELKGYGNMVLIKHSGSKTSSYAHLSRAAVDKYDRVKQGDIIGYVGSTGNVKKPQLHFALRNGKDPVDPKKYISTHVAGL